MKFYTYGDSLNPIVMLIHGGGLSHKMFEEIAKLLQDRYYVVLPLLDGHQDEKYTPYENSKKESDKIVKYIKENHKGKLFLLGGASLGAQIALEVLSTLSIKVEYSILESGIYFKKPFTRKIVCNKFMTRLMMKMLNSNLIIKMSFKQYKLSNVLLDEFINSSRSLSYESNINIYKTYFNYTCSESLKECETKVVFVFGSKEKGMIKKDGKKVVKCVKNSFLKEVKGYSHCELSINHPNEYIKLIDWLIE